MAGERGEAYSPSNSEKIRTDVLSDGRLACNQAREAFFECVEKQSNKKPTELATVGLLYPSDCKKLRVQFENQCRPSWVKHFDRQYCAKKKAKRFLDDNEPKRGPLLLPHPYTMKPSST